MMTNNQQVTGEHNVALQDVRDSTINIIINKSSDYNQLLSQLKDLEDNLADVSSHRIDRVNQIKAKIFAKQEEIDIFKQDVIKLSEIFLKIKIDTDRLEKAKELFYEGKFKEVDIILKLSDIDRDQNALLIAKGKKERELEEITQQLISNSNEYYIKAQATQIKYTSSKYGEIFSLFKRSIKSHSNFGNNYSLGIFMMRNQKHGLAENYLLEALKYKENVEPNLLSNLLNDIGVCFKEQGKYDIAEKYYLDCLQRRRENVNTEDYNFMHDLAMDIMNLGVLYSDWGKFDKDLPLLQEALKIYIDYPDSSDKYFDDLSSCYNNLGKHYIESQDYDIDKVIDYLENSLELRKRIFNNESVLYSHRVATILQNLGISYAKKDNFEYAEKCFHEGINRYEVYEQIGVIYYRPLFLRLLVNTALYYTYHNINRDQALSLSNRAIHILKESDVTQNLKIKITTSIARIFSHFNEELPK